MNTTLEQALKEAYASAPANQVIYDTLEFIQTGVQPSQAIVNQLVSPPGFQALDENSVLKTFQSVAFKFSLPNQTTEGAPTLNLVMDNVNYQVLDFVNTAKATRVPVQAIYRPYVISSNPGPSYPSPAMNPPLKLFLVNISVTLTQVQGQAVFMDLVNRKFPLDLYTLSRFPTLQLA